MSGNAGSGSGSGAGSGAAAGAAGSGERSSRSMSSEGVGGASGGPSSPLSLPCHTLVCGQATAHALCASIWRGSAHFMQACLGLKPESSDLAISKRNIRSGQFARTCGVVAALLPGPPSSVTSLSALLGTTAVAAAASAAAAVPSALPPVGPGAPELPGSSSTKNSSAASAAGPAAFLLQQGVTGLDTEFGIMV